MHDRTTATIEQAAEVVKRARDVDVRHVRVPVVMRFYRLFEAFSLLRWLAVESSNEASVLEHAIDARWTHGDDVAVEHHECEPTIAFQRVLCMKGNDRPFLPEFEPAITGNVFVVSVGRADSAAPSKELALGDPQPSRDRAIGSPRRAAQWWTKSTTASRNGAATWTRFRVPQVLFLIAHILP